MGVAEFSPTTITRKGYCFIPFTSKKYLRLCKRLRVQNKHYGTKQQSEGYLDLIHQQTAASEQ